MAGTWELFKFPFRAAWRLIKLIIVPAALIAVAWLAWDTAPTVFGVIAFAAGIWALISIRLWWLAVRGRMRSLARGAVKLAPTARGRW